MKRRIAILAIALTILCSTSVYALDGSCNDNVQERIGKYIDSIEKSIYRLEQYNDPVDPEVAQLLEDASAELAYARALLEEGDCSAALETAKSASLYVREAAAMLDITEDDIEMVLKGKLKRMAKIQILAESYVKRLNDNDIETPIVDSLLVLSRDSLESASDNINTKRYTEAAKDLVKASEYFEEVQEICKESAYKYQFKVRMGQFIDALPNRFDRAEGLLDELAEQGIDTQRGEELLDEYSSIIDEAISMYQAEDYEGCLRKIYESSPVWKEFLRELISIKTSMNGAS